MRFGTTLAGFTQDGEGVDAVLAGQDGGRGGGRLRARYLVAADGAGSPVREALGITRSGRGFTGGPMVNVYFRADLGRVVRGREFNLCQIEHPDAPGGLASVDGRFRWVFMSPGPVADRDWPALLRTALGGPAPDLDMDRLAGIPGEAMADDVGDHLLQAKMYGEMKLIVDAITRGESLHPLREAGGLRESAAKNDTVDHFAANPAVVGVHRHAYPMLCHCSAATAVSRSL